MAKDSSVAPKERINIKYVPGTADQQEELELPLKLLVLGDFLGKELDENLEARDLISINKNNFNSVMEEADLETKFEVKSKLSEEDENDDNTLNVHLKFNSIQDFSPDQVAQQVPEIKKLVDLREALVALKGPLGNLPQFRTALQDLVDNDENRNNLLAELDALEMQQKNTPASKD